MSKKISIHVESQLPSHIVNNYEKLTKFLIYYYEYMEISGNPIDMNFNYLENISIDTPIDEFYQRIAKKFAAGLPYKSVENNKLLMKNLSYFYNAKGSEESYSFIFEMMFGESPTEYYLPKNNIINLSSDRSTLSSGNAIYDGEYFQRHSYTIKASQTLYNNILENKDIIKKMIHPIGKHIFIYNNDTDEITSL